MNDLLQRMNGNYDFLSGNYDCLSKYKGFRALLIEITRCKHRFEGDAYYDDSFADTLQAKMERKKGM